MRFELDEDQALLKASTREMLASESPIAESRSVMENDPDGYSKKLYAELGQLGYPGLLLSEEEGGMGAIAFAAVLNEMGRVAFPGPFLDLTLAVRVLAGCGGEAAARWSEGARAGEKLVVIARDESLGNAGRGDVATTCEDGRVVGRKCFVPFGAQADALLVETRQGLALVERPDAGFDATPLTTLDHSQRFCQIDLDEPGSLVADPGETGRLLADAARLGALGAAATMLGCMESALESAVAYTSEREAFGVPIGSFQGLQHRAADMLIQTESTRSAVYRAAWAEQAGEPDAAYLIAVAKAWAGPAGRFVCGQAIQLHGGVGFTWEYDLHLWLKRIKTLEQFHGSTREQVEAALVGSPHLRADA